MTEVWKLAYQSKFPVAEPHDTRVGVRGAAETTPGSHKGKE